MKKLFIALALTLQSAAFAATFGVHVGSYHDRGNFNNFNPGVYAKADSGLAAGAYCNSESKQGSCNLSSYLGYSLDSRKHAGVTGSITAGVITGYRRGTMPMVVPSLEYSGVRLAFVPKFDVNSANVLHLMLEKKF